MQNLGSDPTANVEQKAKPTPTVSMGWTFLTNHAHVLIVLAQNPHMRLREVAERVRITERAVQKIVAELEAAGTLTRSKQGRRNQYSVHFDEQLRHPVEQHCTIGDLIRMVHGELPAKAAPADDSAEEEQPAGEDARGV